MRVPGFAGLSVAVLLAASHFAVAEDKAAAAAPSTESSAKAAPVYTDAAAAQHAGEEATVKGKVIAVATSKGGNTYLNFGDRFPKHTFSGVVLSRDAEKIKDLKQFEGKTVSITGKIEIRNEKPQIVISAPAQIQVIEEAGAAKP